MSYKTIRKRTEASFTEKKSEFIGYISPAATEEEAVAFIKECMEKQPFPGFDLPLKAEASAGETFGDMEELEDM